MNVLDNVCYSKGLLLMVRTTFVGRHITAFSSLRIKEILNIEVVSQNGKIFLMCSRTRVDAKGCKASK